MVSRVPSKKAILLLAFAVCTATYFLGVLSGLYANKLLEKKVSTDMGVIKYYMDSSSLDMKNMLLLQFFMENMGDSCKFSELYLSHLYDQLQPYWSRLPKDIEAYDREQTGSAEYIALKREYTRLSLRIWLTAERNQQACNSTKFVPILYFYSKACANCTLQREILDTFSLEMRQRGFSIVIFPIDETFEDDTIYLLKKYYNLTAFPSVVFKNTLFNGVVAGQGDLLQVLGTN
ncbi:MAG: hypothetical protein V1820_01545 [archaeon]